jgi:hypothetical protein
MSKKRSCVTVVFLLALSLSGGIAAGFALGWIVWPVTYVDTDIADLRAGYQDDYIVMTGDAYALDRDLAGAEVRLARLGDPAIGQRVSVLAQSKMAAHEPADRVRSLVLLAEALNAASRDMLDYAATETPTPVPTDTTIPTYTPTSTMTPTSTATPTEEASSTPRPPATATAIASPTRARPAPTAMETSGAWYLATPVVNLTAQAPW